MIIGVGVDLCRVEPIRRSINRFGKDWLDEVFTDQEQSQIGFDEDQAQRGTIGFALKEACSKALGTGFAKGVRRQDFIVRVNGSEHSIRLAGAAQRRALRLCGASNLVQLHTHVQSTTRWVTALVILEAAAARSSLCSLNLLPLLPD